MCEPIADAGVVPPDDSPRGSSSGTPDWSEGCTVVVRRWLGKAAAEASEVGPVELPPKLACNKGDGIVDGVETVLCNIMCVGDVGDFLIEVNFTYEHIYNIFITNSQ